MHQLSRAPSLQVDGLSYQMAIGDCIHSIVELKQLRRESLDSECMLQCILPGEAGTAGFEGLKGPTYIPVASGANKPSFFLNHEQSQPVNQLNCQVLLGQRIILPNETYFHLPRPGSMNLSCNC